MEKGEIHMDMKEKGSAGGGVESASECQKSPLDGLSGLGSTEDDGIPRSAG